ncbi:unnamed protein product [Leptidea sinapis]|uniref:SAC domain-containing protein n=1 Tax=Leptidea sinapis TaxID=189913 RepID=A0A5E4QQR6_9NEOP|nr:unnamed protein product [Leptidea sinapis]
MEVFRSEMFYIFVRNESSLWWNRVTGEFSVRSAWDLSDIEDIECLGVTEGIIGKVEHSNIYDPRLIVIKESVPMGQIYFHHTIYKIKSISIINLGTTNQEVDLLPCTKHGSSASINRSNKKMGGRLFENSAFLNKTVGAVKNVSNTIKSTTQQAATQVKQTVKKQRDPKVAERFEKRLTDELHKIFDDSDSFYYCRTLDLTNSLQRQYDIEKILDAEEGVSKPVTDLTRWWKHSPCCDEWVLPIIQGFIHLSQIACDPPDANPLNTASLSGSSTCDETFTLGVRGSVPIFWSQPDYKFRPPPRLDRTEEESQAAFRKHFEEELKIYKQVCIVNLVEQQGRERIIWEAYGNHVLKYNSPDTAIAKLVLELQLRRLGLGGGGLPAALRQAFLSMWADNGDGDYTRTGERKLTGMMKDGVASANRYYLSTFKDALRQVAIDVMTGESRSIPEQLIVPDCKCPTSVKVLTFNCLDHGDSSMLIPIINAKINDFPRITESLHSICESIMVGRDVAKLPPVPFYDGVKLEKRKSKVHPCQGAGGARSSLYVDLSRLPTLGLTRNVSETQLVADIRSVGSKALTNMSEQFSKLNKLSHSLNARARPSLQLKFDQGAARTRKMFTLGQNKDNKKKGSLSDGMSSDYSSDDDNRTNIFEPTLDNFEHLQHYIGDQRKETEDCDLIQNPLYSSKIETHESPSAPAPQEIPTLKTPMTAKKNPFDNETITPEIQVDFDSKPNPPNSLMLSQKLSQSSSHIYEENQEGVSYHVRSNSQHDISLNIATSHSESALKQLKTIASPASSATRDMVLSPLSKLAKGSDSENIRKQLCLIQIILVLINYNGFDALYIAAGEK